MFLLLPRLKIRISVFAIPAMMVLLWCEGVTAFAILLLSALVHELGHLFAIKVLGYRHGRIDILPMGALITLPEGIPYEQEWKIAFSGPLASLILAVISGVTFFFLPTVPLLFTTVINAVIGLFNLLPIRRMDGGKALFCFLLARMRRLEWGGTHFEEKQKKAERICSVLSNLSVGIFIFVAAFFASVLSFNPGAILLISVLATQLLDNR